MRKRKAIGHHCQGALCEASKKPALLRPPHIFCKRCAAADITARLAEIGYEATCGGKPKGLRKDIMGGILAVAGR